MSKTHQTGWLVNEWDYRNPRCDLDDIECGKYLAALETLPTSIVQMIEDSDMHCQIEEVNDHYRITKIVAKRDPEFIQGTERTFIIDKTGRQIPILEEDLDRLLGTGFNPDDILSSDEVEIVSIDSEYTTPRDMWDVVFDATEYIQQAQKTIKSLEDITYRIKELEEDPLCSPLLMASMIKKYKVIKSVADTIPTIMADSLIYSADWFPKRADKRFITSKARDIANRIQTEDLSKQQLGKLIGKPRKDQRPEKLKTLVKEAEGCIPGKQKAVLMQKAMGLSNEISKDKMKEVYSTNTQIPPADTRKLWDLWQQRQMELHGNIRLQSWQFKSKLNAKLIKLVSNGEITKEEAQKRLTEAMDRLYKIYGSRFFENSLNVSNTINYEDLPDYLRISEEIPVEEDNENTENTVIIESYDLTLLCDMCEEQMETEFVFDNDSFE